MGFVASVETDVGDHLLVLHPDGQLGGKALLSFLTALGNLCSAGANTEPDLKTWFTALEAHLPRSICALTEPLLNAHYDGEWNYRADEYALFRQRSPQMPLTEVEFQQILDQIAVRWREIEQVYNAATTLLHVLTCAQPEATWWYDPDWTMRDLHALTQTLTLAAERHAQCVRIQFTQRDVQYRIEKSSQQAATQQRIPADAALRLKIEPILALRYTRTISRSMSAARLNAGRWAAVRIGGILFSILAGFRS